ncbi:20808_t:CDS:2, partial [Dentiscutata erythropus]
MSEQQIFELACLLKSNNPHIGTLFIKIEKSKKIYELKEEIKKTSPQQFPFNEEDCLNSIKMIDECFDSKISEHCLHIVFE